MGMLGVEVVGWCLSPLLLCIRMHDLRGLFTPSFKTALVNTTARKMYVSLPENLIPRLGLAIRVRHKTTSRCQDLLFRGLGLRPGAATSHAHHSYHIINTRKHGHHPRTSFRVCCFKVRPVSSKLCLCSGRYGMHTLQHNSFLSCILNRKRASFEHQFLIKFSQKHKTEF